MSSGGASHSNMVQAAKAAQTAKYSAKERSKDMNKLKALGVTTVEKIMINENEEKEKLQKFHNDGKAKFKSHLTDMEKETVKNVAHGNFNYSFLNLIVKRVCLFKACLLIWDFDY